VALARALVTHPTLLLLDEPLAALDAKLREEMQLELIGLQQEVGITFVYVTHDQTEALALSHRIAVMNKGRVEQIDAPARLYEYPKSRFVADFIGHCNLLNGQVTAIRDGIAELKVEGLGTVLSTADPAPRAGAAMSIALRPEKIRIRKPRSSDDAVDSDNRFGGKVAEMLYMGDVTVYRVQTDAGARIEALLANSAPDRARFFEIGDRVDVSWMAAAGHLLDG
jgi:spermidine/putrescine transport system ATP-binding protein